MVNYKEFCRELVNIVYGEGIEGQISDEYEHAAIALLDGAPEPDKYVLDNGLDTIELEFIDEGALSGIQLFKFESFVAGPKSDIENGTWLVKHNGDTYKLKKVEREEDSED